MIRAEVAWSRSRSLSSAAWTFTHLSDFRRGMRQIFCLWAKRHDKHKVFAAPHSDNRPSGWRCKLCHDSQANYPQCTVLRETWEPGIFVIELLIVLHKRLTGRVQCHLKTLLVYVPGKLHLNPTNAIFGLQRWRRKYSYRYRLSYEFLTSLLASTQQTSIAFLQLTSIRRCIGPLFSFPLAA
jgi:hypothetical protein